MVVLSIKVNADAKLPEMLSSLSPRPNPNMSPTRLWNVSILSGNAIASKRAEIIVST
jgi:hypothetical protein